jgi:endonuclease-3
MTLAALREKYGHIARELAALYGFPTWRQHKLPVDELVDCILSQSTSDTNRDRAFALLKANFPTWEAVRDADTAAVIEAIRPAGLANQKGPRIQAVLRTISEQKGRITLDFLETLPIHEAKAWLTSLNGVGPKTAAIVLCFAFGKPAFPVDTHVHRVSQRLGLIGPKVGADAAHAILESIVPPETYYQAHLNIIEHGRKVCQARRPSCERCPLTAWCDYYQQTQRTALKQPKKRPAVKQAANPRPAK